MDQKFVSWWCLPILWKYLYIIGLSFVWIHVSGMEKQFFGCLYKTGMISASISSWYLFLPLAKTMDSFDCAYCLTLATRWWPVQHCYQHSQLDCWLIHPMSQSSCQSLIYRQQNITEIIRLTPCTCQKNLWRQREGEREREFLCESFLTLHLFVDLCHCIWDWTLNQERKTPTFTSPSIHWG